jgi:hypothetical protein
MATTTRTAQTRVPQFSFCDAVFNADPLREPTQKCAYPTADGQCPPVAVTIADNNDRLRRMMHSTSNPALQLQYRDVIIAQNQSLLNTLYEQYGVNVSNVEWETIQQQCRNSDGTKMSRAQMAELGTGGYDANRRAIWLGTASLDGAPRPLPPWVAAVNASAITAAAVPAIPIWFDRWFPPAATFVFALFALALVVIILVAALVRVGRPDREVTVVPAPVDRFNYGL